MDHLFENLLCPDYWLSNEHTVRNMIKSLQLWILHICREKRHLTSNDKYFSNIKCYTAFNNMNVEIPFIGPSSPTFRLHCCGSWMEAGASLLVWHVVLINHRDSRQVNRLEPGSQTPVAGTTSVFLSSTAGWARSPSLPAARAAAQGCPVIIHHLGGHSSGCGLDPASPRVRSRKGDWRDRLITLRTSWRHPEEQTHRTACLLSFLILIGEGHFLLAWLLVCLLDFVSRNKRAESSMPEAQH